MEPEGKATKDLGDLGDPAESHIVRSTAQLGHLGYWKREWKLLFCRVTLGLYRDCRVYMLRVWGLGLQPTASIHLPGEVYMTGKIMPYTLNPKA